MATRPSLSFSSPPSVPIARGATLPNPGRKGTTVWSDVAGETLVWDGAKWTTFYVNAPGASTEEPPTAYREVLRTDGRISSIIVWETAAKQRKLEETTITRSAIGVSSTVTRRYDAQGALVSTTTSTVARSTDGRVSGVTTVRV